MGARRNWPQLRGVRGEIIRLHAPELPLSHMLRLLHPRYSVYVVPRAEGRLVVGATSIESDDRSPVSVRGALELLSSAYSMLPALAEARILEFSTQVRPALPDNRPAFCYDRGRRVLSINGLYRHGFLLSPTVVEGPWRCCLSPGQAAFRGNGAVCIQNLPARLCRHMMRLQRRQAHVCDREWRNAAFARTTHIKHALGSAFSIATIRSGMQRRVHSTLLLRKLPPLFGRSN